MQNDEVDPRQTDQDIRLHSFKRRRKAIAIVIVIFIIALTIGTFGYVMGLKKHTQEQLKSPTKSATKPSASFADFFLTVTAPPTRYPVSTSMQPGPTSILVLYRNEKLGFEFKHYEYLYAMEETVDKVSFGFTYPVLTISKNQITDYKSFVSCEYINENYIRTLPCLESGEKWGQKGDIAEEKLGQASAKSFYIAEKYPNEDYPHAYFHIVQANSPTMIEVKMFVGAEGVDLYFKQMLSTFKILDNM